MALLLGGGLCLACWLAAIALALLARRARRAERARVEALLAAYRPGGGTAARVQLDRTRSSGAAAHRLQRLLRYDPRRQAQYPAAPWVIALAAVAASLPLARLAQVFAGPAAWLFLPVEALLLCRGCYALCDRRVADRLYRQFPDTLAMIVRSVRVGLPVVEAVRGVAREGLQPTAAEFAALADQLAIGVALDVALRGMANRHELPEYRFFATALALQSQTGGSLTEMLENLADTIRNRVAARQKGHALAAEARMSAYILGALPPLAGGALYLINPLYMAPLFVDPTGRMLLLAGIGLLAMGGLSMHVLIRRSLS
jgi:tight adherence protein B